MVPAVQPPLLEAVLRSAARLQELVLGAVVVGGSADACPVVADLEDRFGTVLDTLEALDEWSTARVSAGKLILGELGGIETGVRQMHRQRPLEVEEVAVGRRSLRVPTVEEALRINAWLVLSRNRTRDYLDVAALSDRLGTEDAAAVLAAIDDYYADLNRQPDAVATQVARQLAAPAPADPSVSRQLGSYRRLDPKWHDWQAVVSQLSDVAVAMAGPQRRR